MADYITVAGDTWDMISRNVYGSEMHADLLMDANRSLLTTFRFDSGVEIQVPDLPEEKDGLAPPWKFEG